MEFLIPLWEHQKKAIELAKNAPHFAFFHQMGVGKTCTTINVLRHKYSESHRLMNTLIFCPLIVTENWKKEFAMHSKINLKDIIVLKGSQTERLMLIAKNPGPKIFITNYEVLAVMPDLFTALWQWSPEILIFDESHKLKDMKSKRTKAAIKLADQAKYKYLLSGTPILNTPMDIFSQYRILDGGTTFGKNVWAFRSQYFYDKNMGMPKDKYFPDYRIKPGSVEELNKKIYQKAMRVTKEECLSLPDFIEQTIEVGMLPAQAKHYEEMKRDFITFINDKACVATLALTKALRLQQIVSGYMPFEGEGQVTFKQTPRQIALKELLEILTVEHKVIVWATFKENYEQIKVVCEDLKLEYVEVHGEIPNKEKFDNVDRFTNDSKCRVFIGHPGSAGIGVNLVCATYNISFSRNFSLEHHLQARSRSHRGGQTKKVTWINLVTPNTIDSLVLKTLDSKEEMGEKLLSSLRDGI